MFIFKLMAWNERQIIHNTIVFYVVCISWTNFKLFSFCFFVYKNWAKYEIYAFLSSFAISSIFFCVFSFFSFIHSFVDSSLITMLQTMRDQNICMKDINSSTTESKFCHFKLFSQFHKRKSRALDFMLMCNFIFLHTQTNIQPHKYKHILFYKIWNDVICFRTK